LRSHRPNPGSLKGRLKIRREKRRRAPSKKKKKGSYDSSKEILGASGDRKVPCAEEGKKRARRPITNWGVGKRDMEKKMKTRMQAGKKEIEEKKYIDLSRSFKGERGKFQRCDRKKKKNHCVGDGNSIDVPFPGGEKGHTSFQADQSSEKKGKEGGCPSTSSRKGLLT